MCVLDEPWQNLVHFVYTKGHGYQTIGRVSQTPLLTGGGLSKNADTIFASAVWKLFLEFWVRFVEMSLSGNRSHHLYLCGGVVEKNIHLFTTHQETFEQAMKDKAPMTHLVEEASVMLFTDSKLQQYGCGIWYAHQQKS